MGTKNIQYFLILILFKPRAICILKAQIFCKTVFNKSSVPRVDCWFARLTHCFGFPLLKNQNLGIEACFVFACFTLATISQFYIKMLNI